MRLKLQFAIFAGLIVFATGCSKQGNTVYNPAGDEIRIGALLPMTGDAAASGESTRAALELAVTDLNGYFEAIGQKARVKVDYSDSKTDTAEALKQLKIFYENGIRLVIGPYSSSEVLAVRDFADNHGMLIISPSSVAVSLAIPGDNIFRFVSSDRIQGEAMNAMLVEDKVKVIVPLIRDDLWGNDLLASTRAFFLKNGGSVCEAVKYSPGTTDFISALSELDALVSTELSHHNPNEVGVYMLSFSEGKSILLKANQFSSLNNVYWYGGSAYAQNPSALSDTTAAFFTYTHGLPCPVYGLDEAAADKWMPVRTRIQEEIGRMPEVYALTAYDALWVAALASSSAGPSPEIGLLKTAVVKVAENFYGTTGNTRLDENGDRAFGNYDFWAVKSDTTGYYWKKVAQYNSVTGQLARIIE